jgi:hypothetical protein
MKCRIHRFTRAYKLNFSLGEKRDFISTVYQRILSLILLCCNGAMLPSLSINLIFLRSLLYLGDCKCPIIRRGSGYSDIKMSNFEF